MERLCQTETKEMKLLFESWRKFLAEDEKEEFDPGFDEAIKDCDKLRNGMIGADENGASTGCLEEKGFELLGEGGFRNVYALPGSAGKHYVLKVGTNDPQSSKMNEAETDVRMQRNYSDMIPKTYKHADDYKWIVMERVFPWGGENDTNWIKKFFPAFGDEEYIKKQLGIPWRTPWEFFDDFSKAMVRHIREGDEGKEARINSLFVPDLPENKDLSFPERREKGYEARVAFEKTLSPFYKRFIDLAAEYNIEFWDIVARNIGTRDEPKGDKFVILDLSVFPKLGGN